MKVFNKRAKQEYEILEKFEAGIVLSGAEVKSAREGRVSLGDSFVKIRNGEVWLFNFQIHPYRFADIRDFDSTKPKKVLLQVHVKNKRALAVSLSLLSLLRCQQ